MTPGAAWRVADRFAPFGATIFAEMTRLAIEHDAINLGQGFPDFDGPSFIGGAAREAIEAGPNQYVRTGGHPKLAEAIATFWNQQTGESIDPLGEVTINSGATEALAAAMLGLVNPGDEVVLFEPFYDSYRACVAMAGATPRFVPLRPDATTGKFVFDEAELRAAFTDRTKLVLVNTPHNPTGKVFTRDELTLIGSLCEQHHCIALCDEVYERLTFDDALPHVRMATLPGMRERTLTISSLGKTYSYTGWKIGWAIGPEDLTAGIRAAHQFIVFSVPGALQLGAAAALTSPEGEQSVRDLVAQYAEGREFLCDALESIGLDVFRPDGTYFVMADFARTFGDRFEDDVAFCRHLTGEVKVAAIPPSAFYEHPEMGRHLVRFAFCKRPETLRAAADRLRSLRS